MIAALFIAANGCYSDLPDVDPWDEQRDARLYNGPHPVVAHPPCARWGRYWSGGPMLAGTPKAKKLGDDDGCFSAAISSVRKWGGVLEHPEASHAWRAFGVLPPPRHGGWVSAGDFVGGWTCCVEQGRYGHRSKKATWLYACGVALPSLRWGVGPPYRYARLDDGSHSSEERRKIKKLWVVSRLSRRERLATPTAFRDVLISMARTAGVQDA